MEDSWSENVNVANAYTILTNIQGFDSFHLGPTSSTEEITRAFQTQSLIWHPEKNPGDVQALAVFRRMQQAYTLLMDAPSRAELDSRQQSTGTAAPGSAEQLPAGIYSVGLAILLFTVLQNFLLAIVGDAYAAVRS